jgi:hypothetical protein
MTDTFRNSWTLVKASARVLNEDRALLVFPLLSGVAFLALFAAIIVPVAFLGETAAESPGLAIPFFLGFYFLQFFAGFYFNAALVGAALIHLDGGRPTLSDGLRIANDHVGPLLGYAAIAATVGVLLNSAGRRGQLGGRIVSGFVGTAWNLATFLVVPVLVTRDMGPIDALKESARLLRRTWGEQLSGMVGMGAAFGAAALVLGAASVGILVGAAALGPFGLVPVGALLLAFWVLFALATTALQGIYRAAVYRYALTGDAGEGFQEVAMAEMVKREI